MGIANFETDSIYKRWLDKLEEESLIQRIIDEEYEQRIPEDTISEETLKKWSDWK